MSSSAKSSKESYIATINEELVATENTINQAQTEGLSTKGQVTSSFIETEKIIQPKTKQSWKNLIGSTGSISFRPITSEDTNFFRNKENLFKIAKLANLVLSKDEEKKFADQLTEALVYIEQLNEVSTKGRQAVFNVTGLKNIFREDEIQPSLYQEEALQNTRNKENGYFKVKAIFNES